MTSVLKKLIIKWLSVWDKYPEIIVKRKKKGSEGQAINAGWNGREEFMEMLVFGLGFDRIIGY